MIYVTAVFLKPKCVESILEMNKRMTEDQVKHCPTPHPTRKKYFQKKFGKKIFLKINFLRLNKEKCHVLRKSLKIKIRHNLKDGLNQGPNLMNCRVRLTTYNRLKS